MAKNPKRYNLKAAAAELGVHRLTLYYWLKKGWISDHPENKAIIP